MTPELLLQHGASALALLVAWVVFCNGIGMSSRTDSWLRTGMAALGMASAALVMVPWVYPTPAFEVCVLIFMAATLNVFIVLARLWRERRKHFQDSPAAGDNRA